MAKVQGEGDYASARRYNSETRKFVKSKGKAATRAPGGGVDRAALRKARSKARDDGTCPTCGNYRAVCSPMGRPCCFIREKDAHGKPRIRAVEPPG